MRSSLVVLRRIVPSPIRRLVRKGSRPMDELRMVYRAMQPITPDKFMIDVGAHHGSSLLAFAQQGGQVIAFEPDTANRQVLAANVAGLGNVRIHDTAVGAEGGELVPFYTSPTSTGISSLAPFESRHTPTDLVRTTTLRASLNDANVQDVEFLKIDTEGFDMFVLQGFPWERIRPRFIVCEFEDRKSVPLGYDRLAMTQYLQGHGYTVLTSEWFPISQYGVAHYWRRFHQSPAVPNANSWGNLIAARDDQDFRNLVRMAAWYGRWELIRQFIARLRTL